MRTITALSALLLLTTSCIGNDDHCDLCDYGPFFTGCPNGMWCIDGCCEDQGLPACMQPGHPDYPDWPNDSDLEPNDHPDLAVTLPCGEDAVFTDPQEYAARCSDRIAYTHGFMNVLICPTGDHDFYAIYLLADETVTFVVRHETDPTLPRDLDASVWAWDFAASDWREDVAVGISTNDDEELTVSTEAGSGNAQGWYYLAVYGKGFEDLNFYTVSFTLSATQ